MRTGLLSDTVTPGHVALASLAYADASPLLSAAARRVMALDDGEQGDATTYALLALPRILRDTDDHDNTVMADDYARRAIGAGRQESRRERMRSSERMRAVTDALRDPTDGLTWSLRDISADAPTRADRSAVWSDGDTLTVLADLQGGERAAILRALASMPQVWTGTGRVNIAGLARALGLPDTGQARTALTGAVADALASARADASRVADWRAAGRAAGADAHGATDPGNLRDDRESGTASLVVRTGPDGVRWALFPTCSVRLSESGAERILSAVDRVAPYVSPAAGVPLSALHNGTADASATMPDHLPTAHLSSAARRPAGVGAGMRYGTTGIAGEGAPDVKRTPSSRKSGPKGGVGGPMLTGRSTMGNGANAGSAVAGTTRATCNGHAEPQYAGAYCAAHGVAYCTGDVDN